MPWRDGVANTLTGDSVEVNGQSVLPLYVEYLKETPTKGKYRIAISIDDEKYYSQTYELA